MSRCRAVPDQSAPVQQATVSDGAFENVDRLFPFIELKFQNGIWWWVLVIGGHQSFLDVQVPGTNFSNDRGDEVDEACKIFIKIMSRACYGVRGFGLPNGALKKLHHG